HQLPRAGAAPVLLPRGAGTAHGGTAADRSLHRLSLDGAVALPRLPVDPAGGPGGAAETRRLPPGRVTATAITQPEAPRESRPPLRGGGRTAAERRPTFPRHVGLV